MNPDDLPPRARDHVDEASFSGGLGFVFAWTLMLGTLFAAVAATTVGLFDVLN